MRIFWYLLSFGQYLIAEIPLNFVYRVAGALPSIVLSSLGLSEQGFDLVE